MNITLKLGTYFFLKSQLTSADTLLKPLLSTNADHLLIKKLSTFAQYRSINGSYESSNKLYSLTYLKLNPDQAKLFEDKLFSTHPYSFNSTSTAVFQKRDSPREYLIIKTFTSPIEVKKWGKKLQLEIQNQIQGGNEEDFGFFTKSYSITD
ncbi:hypothetical protein COSHB9_22050 [Companilactobacillus alimentarius]|uniref:ABM domain-containing protein n=1 Tax=Companilactobacillus alimentarius DSM 20249 TaxID=1423720 RepID=A0A2K9HGV1_9LACO|nr:hypothetical protein [Companilactobacillus alimentarius]AUI71618.1 hypothetical protein LA20249_05225 [Companilactobacillus alimentarius DSM 20249]MDT6953398.1 hypothetical protein [Companilactobacillus alimentarius]GEO44650.1 hypothetical protein LAL01_08820 [Companilactobacillus alimentarius]